MGLFNRKSNKREEGRIFLLSIMPSRASVMDAVGRHLGFSTEGRGNKLTLKKEDMEIKLLVAADDMGGEAAEFLKDQINRIWGRFYQVTTSLTDIKINLLYQIKLSRSMIVINYSYEIGNEEYKKCLIADMFAGLMPELEGIMLIMGAEDGIYGSDETGKRQLILSVSGESERLSYLPQQKFMMTHGEQINQAQIERRLRSRAVLESKSVYVPVWYPVIENRAVSPSHEAVAQRAVALLIVALYSECMLGEKMARSEACDFVRPIIDRFAADTYFSPKEKQYIENENPDEAQLIAFSWQYENLLVMEWALGLIDQLDFPDHICNVPLAVCNMKNYHSIVDLLDQTQLRTEAELLDQCDLIFCLDWACVETRIKRLPAPAGMEGGVVMERHKSLNWLIGYGEQAPWDQVGTDT